MNCAFSITIVPQKIAINIRYTVVPTHTYAVFFERIISHTMTSAVQRTPPAGSSKTTLLATKRQRTDDQDRLRMFSAESNVNTNSITLEGMLQTMMQQFVETRQLIDTVRSEIMDVNSKIDSVKQELQSDMKSVKDEFAAKFQYHDKSLDSLNSRVDGMSQKIGALQYRNELIISGIPFQNGENLQSMLKEIGKHLAVTDTISPMARTRRMKSGSDSDSDGLIVVEFAMKATRDEFYSAYLCKRDLKLKHIGLDSDRRIYINENLTMEVRKLKSAALHRKKAGKLTSVYTKDGIVHVKHAVGGPPIAIQSVEELDKL